jgi:hypothetical protein
MDENDAMARYDATVLYDAMARCDGKMKHFLL